MKILDILKMFWLKILLGTIVLVTVIWAYRSYSGRVVATVADQRPVAQTSLAPTPSPSPAISPSPVPATTPTPPTLETQLDPDMKKVNEAMMKLIILNEVVLGEQNKVQIIDDLAKKATGLQQQEIRLANERGEAKAAATSLNYITRQKELQQQEQVGEDRTAAFNMAIESAVTSAMEARRAPVQRSSNPCVGLSPRTRRICEENRRAQELYRN